jgi:hypothetical protein
VTIGQRALRFLTSRKNIGACLVALGAAALFVLGVTGGWIGLAAIPVAYAAAFVLVPGERGVSLKLFDANDVYTIKSGLNDLEYSLRFRVADDVMAALKDTIQAIELTLPADANPSGTFIDPTVMLIRQTALHYLPEALNSYLALPRMYAENVPVQDGKTARDVLIDQLKLIDAKMRETATAMYRNDADQLLANARFLQERFADSNLQVPAVDLGYNAQHDTHVR